MSAGIALMVAACRSNQSPPPPTLSYRAISFGGVAERTATGTFTAETGIRVVHEPMPESVSERLALTRRLLESRDFTTDVLLIDVTWPPMLAEHLMDLQQALPDRPRQHFPALVANDTVQGRLVALPAYTDVGLLFYRTDLLAKYGYRGPPKTWEALEAAAARIQAGERAAGNERFWGYVWEGAPGEALTCNALEWQASQGGGRIVEDDGRVTVDNPAAAFAFTRAARWVGTISPPGVVSFLEEDAREVWQAGDAAFMRNWSYAFLPGQAAGSPIKGRFAVGHLPSGAAGAAHTLGGWQLAVSQYTRHPEEALRFVRFMSGTQAQRIRVLNGWNIPTVQELYEDGGLMRGDPRFTGLAELAHATVVARPSGPAGRAYSEVSSAYARTVHSILTGEEKAGPALAALQARLVGLLGRSPQSR